MPRQGDASFTFFRTRGTLPLMNSHGKLRGLWRPGCGNSKPEKSGSVLSGDDSVNLKQQGSINVVSGRRRHEFFNVRDGVNAASGPACGAVERRGCAGKIELPLKGPALEQSINESCVEDVSRAGGVDDWHTVCGTMKKLGAIPGQHAILSQCCRGK